MRSAEPLVCVVTPVYNGAQFLRECVDSVLQQGYRNWRYLIVNNRSTDETLAIAQAYAAADTRIRVHDCTDFLPIIENHNRAIGLIDAECVYCKPLMADDRLNADCISAMVECALQRSTVGLVCCLATTADNQVLFDELRPAQSPAPAPYSILMGREAGRIPFLEGRNFFGSPTTTLLRADLVRKRHPFYDPLNLHADAQACCDVLRESDFGFVHRPLAYIREHAQSHTSRNLGLESMRAGRFYTLARYGRDYLSDLEFQECHRRRLSQYYSMLAEAAVELRGKEFWDFHRRMLSNSGERLDRVRLAYTTASHIVHRLASPKSVGSFVRRMGRALRRVWSNQLFQ